MAVGEAVDAQGTAEARKKNRREAFAGRPRNAPAISRSGEEKRAVGSARETSLTNSITCSEQARAGKFNRSEIFL